MTYSRYKGHRNADYKLDSCLSHDDAYVISGSEDGRIYFWDLVEVSQLCVLTNIVLFETLCVIKTTFSAINEA